MTLYAEEGNSRQCIFLMKGFSFEVVINYRFLEMLSGGDLSNLLLGTGLFAILEWVSCGSG